MLLPTELFMDMNCNINYTSCRKKVPELTVQRCELHTHRSRDAKLDKLSSWLEARIKHKRCCHCSIGKENDESILRVAGEILRLRKKISRQPTHTTYIPTRIVDLSDYVCSVCSDTSSLHSWSSAFTDESLSDIEQIKQARVLLIQQRCEILGDPDKVKNVDFAKIRQCLRQYYLMDRKPQDYDSNCFNR